MQITKIWCVLICALSVTTARAEGHMGTTLTRDPNQLSTIVVDVDGSFLHNIGNFRVKLGHDPGLPGLGLYSGLPEEVQIPIEDFEGNVGHRVGELLGHYAGPRFAPSAAVREITLSNGQKIRPGYYYLPDGDEGYTEFRPPIPGEVGYLKRGIDTALAEGKQILLPAAAFVGLAFNSEYQDSIRGIALTKRGQDPNETKSAFETLRDQFQWGNVVWPREAYVNLMHSEFARFGASKDRYIDELYRSLARRKMANPAVPHFLVMVENDKDFLEALAQKMQNLANRGVFANPVVPVLVNLLEAEVFANPDGIDWRRSRLETEKPSARVTIYWPNATERTDELSRVFELVLQQDHKTARATFESYKNAFWCKSALSRMTKSSARRKP